MNTDDNTLCRRRLSDRIIREYPCHPWLVFLRVLCGSIAFTLLPGISFAQGKPEVKSTSFAVVKTGQAATVTIFGENLAPTSAQSANSKLSAKLGTVKATDAADKAKGSKQLTLDVSAAADCPRGPIEVTLVQGTEKPKFLIDVVEPSTQELTPKRPCNTFPTAMPLNGSSVAITGNLNGDSPDLFRFDAKTGETWEITVAAGGAGSPLDAVLRLRNARRIPLAISAGSEKQDRRIAYKVPADGIYYIEISENEAKGGPEYMYRLMLKKL